MKLKLLVAAISLSPMAFAAVPKASKISSQNSLKPNAHEQSLYEQLAGQPASSAKAQGANVKAKKIAASATKALALAKQSRHEKNYILAIKRYNFILKYYPRTPQAKAALMDKASMYKEMGLNDPYVYNQKKVSAMKLAPNSVISKPAAKAPMKSTIKR